MECQQGGTTSELPVPYIHCKKHHFVSNTYIYLIQSNIDATQDIYLLQKEFVIAKHNLLSFQIVPITLTDIISFK